MILSYERVQIHAHENLCSYATNPPHSRVRELLLCDILITHAGDRRWPRYQAKSLACPGCEKNIHKCNSICIFTDILMQFSNDIHSVIEVVKKMCGNKSFNIDDFNTMLTELKDLDKESLDLAARINDVYGDTDTCTKRPVKLTIRHVKLPDRTKPPTNVPPTALVKPQLNSKFVKNQEQALRRLQTTIFLVAAKKDLICIIECMQSELKKCEKLNPLIEDASILCNINITSTINELDLFMKHIHKWNSICVFIDDRQKINSNCKYLALLHWICHSLCQTPL